MDAVREAWTDERLDDLANRVDRGFDRVDEDLREVRAEIATLATEVNSRFDTMQRTMVQGAIALSAAFLAGFAALAALISAS